MLADTLGRPLRNLRISVTDRCNLRCQYCMPEQEYVWLDRHSLLSFEEIARLVDVFIGLGVDRVRLTGGEPLLRRNLHELVGLLAARPALKDIALTTNGLLLAEQAQRLKAAGLQRLNISVDTLRPERFRAIARSDQHSRLVEGIDAVRGLFAGLKFDTVVMRGVNDDELVPLIDFGRAVGAEVRFIEYMDVGGATQWSWERVVSRREILERLGEHYGSVTPVVEDGSTAPADRFVLPDGTVFGVISSTTEPFCRTCDRARITADGLFYLCLYAMEGLDLRGPLRAGASEDDLRTLIADRWRARADRGAEMRLELRERGAYLPASALKADPHLEMHKRGG